MAGKKLKFEDTIQKIEDIVATLEAGDVPLEKSLKLFEEGIGHLRACNEELNQAEQVVEKLIQNNGELQTAAFNNPDEDEDA